MTKPIFKTRCERFLEEFRALEKKYDVSLHNDGLRNGYETGIYTLMTDRPLYDGKIEQFELNFSDGVE